jgi:hypothetical protein
MTNKLEKELEKFRETHTSVRVTVFSDCLVYKCSRGYSDKAALAANGVIEKLGLDLYAVGTKFPSKDSYTVQSIFSDSL